MNLTETVESCNVASRLPKSATHADTADTADRPDTGHTADIRDHTPFSYKLSSISFHLCACR